MSHAPYVKRAIDVAAATIGLVLFAAPMLAVATAIRVSMGSPVIFRQQRPGKGGAPFDLLKFRTMRPPLSSERATEDDGMRVTALGVFLRRTSLDELPTLWNVLRGDMSLVGPRPLLMEYLPLYSPEQARRHAVRPGLTGWAQIHGRNDQSWEERLSMDVWYVDHRSLLLDIRIIIATVGKVLSGAGVSSPGHATMPKFRGNRT
ncbi:MAG: putative sugar transferase EpsL [Gammaproteobacteria bacterium]|nr:putative sugar transferase EpsL [Gammaproteobacteria bacterium]